MQIAQPALTVLDIGFDDIATVAHPLVARIPFRELGRDIVPCGTSHDFRSEPSLRVPAQPLVAPNPSCLEQGSAYGDVLPRGFDKLVGSTDRLADLQFQVPQYVEQGLDYLAAPLRALFRHQEHKVEVAERGHFAAPRSAQPNDRDAACRSFGPGMNAHRDEIICEA